MASSSPPSTYNLKGGGDQHIIPTDQNVLQKHVAFFDRNHDGIVYPSETFQGFRAIGCGFFLSTFAAVFINVGLSRKTRPGKSLSLLFPIEVKNIHRAKHGSDSGVYDSEGRFVPGKFEEIFSKHARTNSNSLTSDELMGMLKANRVPKDYAGWLASWTEWKILYILCKDKNGLLPKQTVKAVYDGSLFEQMEKERSSSKKKA
ncbi:probable peroxygenase 4 isoform X2 [Alnus glutinosa]|nr:probable peroxygenase 4 isoform X2 [Alnus glutinosa]